MSNRLLNTPWATNNDLYSPPGSLIVKLALGEAPESIPPLLNVRRGSQTPVTSMSVDSIDRVLRHMTDRVQITHLHTPAVSAGSPQHPADCANFNAVEHAVGLARTFRIEAGRDASVSNLVDALRQLAVVEDAYPNYMCVLPYAEPFAAPKSTDLDAAWTAHEQVAATTALAYETGDPAVIVAIVDTGVAQAHPELPRLRSGFDAVQIRAAQMAAGVRLIGDHNRPDTDPEDVVGHGTACAAIIGARGEHLPPGLAGDCSMIAARVLGGAMFPGKTIPVGIGALADIDLGMKQIIDLGARVINMSFGTPVSLLDANDPLPHNDVIRYALMRGCVLVAASGNSSRTERFSPACIDGVIAVGAVGGDDLPTAFMTRGDHVALCAPGVRIFTAGLEGYQAVTGTSFAAPFVAATAALLLSRAARRSYPLDGQQVRRLLMDSTVPFESAQTGCGTGHLNAYAALSALDREIDQSRRADELFEDGAMMN